MIASSKLVKVAALTVAAALHVGVSNGLAPDVKVELESAAGAAQAAIGSSFADMSKGVMTAQPVEAEAEPAQPTTDLSDRPDPARIPTETPVETVARPEPETSTLPDIQPAQIADSQSIASTRPVTPTAPTPSVQTTTPPVQTLRAAPSPTALAIAATPVQPSETQSAAPATRVTAITPEQTAPAASKRPKRRDPAKETKVAATPKPDTRAKPPRQTKGNTNRNARKGAVTGQRQAKAAAQGTTSGNAKTSGNAAASNYPGKVMRRLARVQKVRGMGRGKAEVAFKIASNGGLAGASLRRSSGSGAFDKAAVRAVQRAAPFPPPPAGAQRSFKILITGS